MNREDLLALFVLSRQKKREWEIQENLLKPYIHEMMNQDNTDTLDVQEDMRITRHYQTREFLSKEDVPERTWNRYAHSSTYPVFTISRVQRLRSLH